MDRALPGMLLPAVTAMCEAVSGCDHECHPRRLLRRLQATSTSARRAAAETATTTTTLSSTTATTSGTRIYTAHCTRATTTAAPAHHCTPHIPPSQTSAHGDYCPLQRATGDIIRSFAHQQHWSRRHCTRPTTAKGPQKRCQCVLVQLLEWPQAHACSRAPMRTGSLRVIVPGHCALANGRRRAR